MKKTVLCSLCFLGCAGPTRSVISSIDRIVMQDADAFVLMVRDPATGEVRPRKIYAEDVHIVFDLAPDAPAWAEYVDALGELRGEGDRLILHVRSLDDVDFMPRF